MDTGIVIKATGNLYIIRMQDGSLRTCSLRGRMRTEESKDTNPVAVGDRVVISSENIEEVLPRKNFLIRKATNLSRQVHIIAANVDCVCVVVSLRHPETPIEFIDRCLVSAQAYDIPACLVFNKIDLYTEEERTVLQGLAEIYEAMEYPVMMMSLESGEGVKELEKFIKGKQVVLTGLSGVGKSSIINSLVPDRNIKVGEISQVHKSGKHTTTFAEMYEMPQGGAIIDTPGLRAFGIVNIEREEVYHYFRDIFKYSHQCAYNNCLHLDEPECAVRQAVIKGEIAESRYMSYLSLMEDDNSKYRNKKR